MNWMTFLWPMMSGACVTLALISLRISFGEGRRLPHLLFSLCAFAVAAISGFELALMRTTNLTEYDAILRWAVVPIFIMVASAAGFLWTFLRAGRLWLGLTAVALNGASQIANLLLPIPAVRHAVALHQEETFGGVQFTVPTIGNGPWNIIELASVIVLLLFILDAAVTVWRRGERRRATIVGGGMVFFFLFARGHAVLVEGGFLQTPYLVSFSFIWVLLAMAYELSEEVLGASRLDRKLRESEQRMNLAAEAANLGLWVWDVERDEVWITETGRTLFGFDAGQQLTFASFSGRVHPEDRQNRDSILRQTVKTQVPYSTEYRVVLPGGTHRWIASRGRCVDAKNGKNKRLLGVLMDVTPQREAEYQIQQKREEVAHLGRVSMMGQLASALAHELNQPLGAILRNAEAAEIFLESDDPDLDELRAIVTDIRKDDQRAGEVIDRLRSMLKRRDVESMPLEIGELLRDVAALARPDAATRQVELRIGALPTLPQVRADRVHVQQVLLNLVLNAMDAIHDVPAEKKLVTLRAHHDGNGRIEISVSDTGHGIAAEKLGQVFEPFFTTKAQGMGMGLAISRTIVEAHGGRIWAENNDDGGATFRFTLATVKNGTSSHE